jgi:hypothetical protein
MKAVAILWAAALAAQTRDISFDGVNVLKAERKADLVAGDHRVELRRGKAVFQIQDSGAPAVEIETPCVTVHPYLMGAYQIEVKKSGETTITPYGGDVKVSAPQGVQWVPVGRKMIARGSRSNPEFRIVSALSGWKWIAAQLATFNSHSSGVSVDTGVSTSSDDSSPSRPSSPPSPPPAAPASSVGAGSSNSDSRSGSHGSHGK